MGRFFTGGRVCLTPNPSPAFITKIDAVSKFHSAHLHCSSGEFLGCYDGFYVWLVYGRYVLNDTPTWVEQVSLLLVMVITFLGAAVGVHQHSHLSVVVFRNVSLQGRSKLFCCHNRSADDRFWLA